MTGSLTPRSASTQIDAFLNEAGQALARADRGRLIFALDATLSRQRTWDLAQSLQAKMFDVAADVGGLDVQLVYFRGHGECRASRFVDEGRGLAGLMAKIDVRGGTTQWAKVLTHARSESSAAKVGALVMVGDAMEENADALGALAGELALLNVKVFAFHEGDDPRARAAFQEIARITGGAYGAFDAGASARLAALLRAAAAYAAGGRAALEALAAREPQARPLLAQMRR
jgi:hypothetical protein